MPLRYLCISWLLLLLTTSTVVAQAPTLAPKDVLASQQDGNQVTINFTRGNGARRIVIARRQQPVTSVPQNGKDYNHQTQFGLGETLQPDEFVVYDGEHAGFVMTGLAPNTTYHLAVFEYNGSSFSTQYLLTPARGTASTLAAPSIPASQISFSQLNGNSVRISWINGNGNRRLVLMREGGPIQVNPADLVTYNGNTVFGLGANLGNQTYSVAYTSNNTVNSVDVTYLNPSKQYYVKVFELVGNSGPVYQPAGAPEASFTTLDRPTQPTSGLVAGTREANSLNLAWNNGNGTRRLVIAREGQPNSAIPADGIDPIPNTDFTKAVEIAPGHKAIYNADANRFFTMTGLKKGTTYYFKFYESSGTGNQTTYLSTTAPELALTTFAEPTQAPSALLFSNASTTGVTATVTPGNGTGRLFIMKAGAPVDAMPQENQVYNAVQSFGMGSQIGNGNFAVQSGPGNQVNVINLTPGVTYHYAVFEYNGNSTRLYHPQPVRGSFTQSNRPSVAASAFRSSLHDVDKFRLGWTNGNGQFRLVIMRKGQPVSMRPQDGISYSTNARFDLATDLGEGHKAVYAGSSTVVDVTGLEPNSTYHISIFEGAGSGAQATYLTQTILTGQASTLGAPSIGSSQLLVQPNGTVRASLRLTAGNGSGRLWVMRKDAPVSFEPQDLQNYSSSNSFGHTGAHVGNGHYVISQQNTNIQEVINLEPGTTYHFAVFEYNGSNNKVYNRQQVARLGFSTLQRPTVASTALSVTQLDGASMRLGWTNGNGQFQLIVARAGAPVQFRPTDGVRYTANANFAQAPTVGADEKIVYNGSTGVADLNGLLHATTYHFAVFDYAVANGQAYYLTSSWLSGQQATVGYPTVQTSNAQASNIGANQATIGWTNGNGSQRMLLIRKGQPVTVIPQQYVNYSASTSFASAGTLPDGSRVMARTSNTSAVVAGLEAGTTYHFALFEYNGTSAPAFLQAQSATGSFTTIGAPQEAATQAMVDQQTNTSLRLRWTNGSGQRRLIAVSENAPVSGAPADLQRYTANSFFGNGQQLPAAAGAAPAHVVYNGTGSEVVITNLKKDVRYYFAIWEFNDFGATLYYQAVAPLRGELSANAPLPLQLLAFTATPFNHAVRLQWTTAQESNTSHFDIEHSNNGQRFEKIGRIAAAGHSVQTRQYQYEHAGTGAGNYRLRMVDIDGSFSYSSIVQVNARSTGTNPNLQWLAPQQLLRVPVQSVPAHVVVLNMHGQQLRHAVVAAGSNTVSLAGLPAGTYEVVYWYKQQPQHLRIAVL